MNFVAHHISPSSTGHLVWGLLLSGDALGRRVKNRIAFPFVGFKMLLLFAQSDQTLLLSCDGFSHDQHLTIHPKSITKKQKYGTVTVSPPTLGIESHRHGWHLKDTKRLLLSRAHSVPMQICYQKNWNSSQPPRPHYGKPVKLCYSLKDKHKHYIRKVWCQTSQPVQGQKTIAITLRGDTFRKESPSRNSFLDPWNYLILEMINNTRFDSQ